MAKTKARGTAVANPAAELYRGHDTAEKVVRQRGIPRPGWWPDEPLSNADFRRTPGTTTVETDVVKIEAHETTWFPKTKVQWARDRPAVRVIEHGSFVIPKALNDMAGYLGMCVDDTAYFVDNNAKEILSRYEKYLEDIAAKFDAADEPKSTKDDARTWMMHKGVFMNHIWELDEERYAAWLNRLKNEPDFFDAPAQVLSENNPREELWFHFIATAYRLLEAFPNLFVERPGNDCGDLTEGVADGECKTYYRGGHSTEDWYRAFATIKFSAMRCVKGRLDLGLDARGHSRYPRKDPTMHQPRQSLANDTV